MSQLRATNIANHHHATISSTSIAQHTAEPTPRTMANRQLPHQRNLPPHATPYTSWLGAAKEPWLAQPFKSGLTPITYSDSLSDLDPEKYWYNQRCEAYQKQQFYQFTSQHFIDLRSTNHFGDSVSPSTLTLIHPIFKRSNWIDSTSNVKPLHYLPRGWTGAWSGQNDVVWDLLQPVLALATQFLENSDAWDWYVASTGYYSKGLFNEVQVGRPSQRSTERHTSRATPARPSRTPFPILPSPLTRRNSSPSRHYRSRLAEKARRWSHLQARRIENRCLG